jgi:muconolactone delta-isomerase
MQFLVDARSRTEDFERAAFEKLLPRERHAVRALYSQGVVRAAWHRKDIVGVFLLMEAADEDEVQAALGTLPFARNGMLELQIIPLTGYQGFGPD